MDKGLQKLLENSNTGMAVKFKVLPDSDVLDEIVGADSREGYVNAYLLRCDEKDRNALYIPGALVVVEALGLEEFGVPASERTKDYFNSDSPSVLMNRGEFGYDGKLFIEDVGYVVKEKVTLPLGLEDYFKNSSFDYADHHLAIRLLMDVKKGIKNSGKGV